MADPKTKTPNSLVGMLKWNPASGKWFVWDGEITGTVAISGTVAVSGPLTDAELRASTVYVASPPLAIRLDDGATYLYVGKAAVGTLNGDSVWQIQRITQADTTVEWADGDADFDNVWDNRASLSYS